MFCNNCGNQLSSGSSFCPNCGKNLSQNIQNNNQINSQYSNQNFYNNKQKVTSNWAVLIAGCVILVLVVTICLLGANKFKSNDDSKKEETKVESRTIMIYLCGSDLESQIALASSDLDSVKPSEIDLETTNIVVYTGGSSNWHNYVSNHENAIYVLEEDGFVKKEVYDKQSMGKSSSLTTLFDYAYTNYEADRYDLIMWNHGLGALGISSDEQFNNDYLDLNEVTESLKKSNFKGNNKLETVVFRSCLNSTLEMASIFVPYANYFVASEEVTYGSNIGGGVFDFLNDITLEDDGVEFGKKFIANYEHTLQVFADAKRKTLDQVFGVLTYSIIDLSKIDEIEKKLGLFFNSLKLDLNYSMVAKVRSNLYQYAGKEYMYDTVDLRCLVQELKSLSSSKGDDVLKLLDEAVVYNWGNDEDSNGLAIYFPFYGTGSVRELHYSGYKNLSDLKNYYNFIQKFDSMQSSSSNGGFSIISKDDIKIDVVNKQLSLELYDDNIDNYAKASYIIVKKDNNGNFMPVFTSNTFELAKNSYAMDLNMNLIRVINMDDNTSTLLSLNTNKFGTYYTNVNLVNDNRIDNADIYLNDDLSILRVTQSNTQYASGMSLSLDSYDKIRFITNSYNILSNGEVNDKWEDNPILSSFEVGSNYKFEKITLDDSYYVMFKIYDVDNLYTYSDLIQIK